MRFNTNWLARVCLFLPLFLVACLPVMEFQSNGLRASGLIYLPLPDGITVGGKTTSESMASSKYFAERLTHHIEQDTQFRVIVDETFLPSGSLAERKAAAFSAAKAAGADYAMMVTLGEYNDAAFMAFSADSLTVKSLRVYDVESDTLAFGLQRPYAKTTSNASSLNGVLNSIAKEAAKNMSKTSGE